MSAIKKLARRDFIQLASAAAFGPFVHFPGRALAGRRTLKIAKWAHFLPEYDRWFENDLARQWGEKNDTDVIVDHIPLEKVHSLAATEARAGQGHDVFIFPWPSAEFCCETIDHSEIYQRVSFKFGSTPQISYKSTFNPKTKSHFAFTDYWVPSPLHYFEDLWADAGMPLGPVHYGSLRTGAQSIRANLGIPCGLALTPTLEGNVSLHTLLYAFRGQVLDADGNVAINKTVFMTEALRYVKALNRDAGTPDEFSWGPAGNVKAMLARKTSCTSNAISLLRAAESEKPDLAKKIKLQPPLLGPYGVTAFPHVTNCSAVWKFAENKEGAKQFLVDLLGYSRTGYEKSLGCNFPAFPKTVPNLIVRLEKDPQAQPHDKYDELKDALHWTPNLGSPGFASPAWMEVFNSSVLPRMFASVIKGERSAEDAASAAEAEVKRIAEKWAEKLAQKSKDA